MTDNTSNDREYSFIPPEREVFLRAGSAKAHLNSLSTDLDDDADVEAHSNAIRKHLELIERRTDPAADPDYDPDERTLEQKAFDDLDAIATVSEHALAELDTGELDELEGSIRAIHDRASAWEDP